MESVKTNEAELTSTMGNLMSTSKSEKTDASDSTPTSSTDAFTATSTSQIAADDPISSTSSDVLDPKKSTEKVTDVAQNSTNVMSSNPVMKKDLLAMNITDTSTEKITENVDDIVQDLENLLGEPTASFDFTVRTRDYRKSCNASQDKDMAVDIDQYSAELQMLSEQTSESKKIPKNVIHQHVDTKKDMPEPVKNHIKEDLKVGGVLTNSAETITEKTTTDTKENTESVSVEESPPVDGIVTKSENNTIEGHVPKDSAQEIENSDPDTNAVERKDNATEKTENCQSELISESCVTEKNKPSTSDVPSVHPTTEAVEEPQCSVAEMSKDTDDERSDLLSSQNIPSVPDSRVVLATGYQQIEKAIDRQPELISSAVTNDASVEAVTDVPCAEVAKQTDDTVVEVKDQKLVHVEEGTLIATEDCGVSDDVNAGSIVVPEEVKKIEEIQHSECAADTDENKVMNNIETEIKESPKSPAIQEPESPMPIEILTEVQGQKSDVAAGAAEATALDEKRERVEEMPESVKEEAPEAVEEKTPAIVNQETPESVNEDTPESVNEETPDSVKEEIYESVRGREIPESVKEETSESVKEGASKGVKEEKRECLKETEKVEEISYIIEEQSEHADKVTERIEEAATLVHQGEEPIEVAVSTIADTQVEKMEEVNVVHADNSAEEEAARSVELTQIRSEAVDQIQSVCSSNEEEANIQEIANPSVLEDSNVGQISEPLEIRSATQTIDEQKPEQLEEQSEMLLPSEKGVEKPETGVATKEASEVQTDLVQQVKTNEIEEIQFSVPSEQSKPPEETLQLPMEVPTIAESVPDVAPADFVPENTELSQDLDLLGQNTIDESLSAAVSSIEEKSEETSADDLKDLTVVENNVLPLAVDVPDLEVLNAISSLSDNQSDIQQNISDNHALLSSSTLEEHSSGDVPFETNIDSALPTVEDIFAETGQQQIDAQDENLETLLAVASLQNDDYNIPLVEDFTPTVEPISNFMPEDSLLQQEAAPTVAEEESTKIEDALLERGETVEEAVKPVEVTERPEVKQVAREQENNVKEPLTINVEDNDKERVYSPKITIKPIKPPEAEEEAVTSGCGDTECSKGSLKMTITKQSDNTHSILKIYDADHDEDQPSSEPSVPKLIIKPIVHPNEQPQSPKMSTRSSKQVFSPSSSANQRSASPRITIKPIPKPDEPVAPLKITIKPVLKGDETHKQKHSPKLTIKPVLKPEEESSPEPKMHSPRVTIKPIVKPPEETEQMTSPRITIKPIVKPIEVQEPLQTTPRLTIKPVLRPPEKEKNVEPTETVEKSSPKITIKPIVKPQEPEPLPLEDFEESIKERIVLKINKGTIPGSSKELRKRDVDEEKSEKLPKMKLKFSKGGGHPQIVQDQSPTKRPSDQTEHEKSKRQRMETPDHFLPATTTPIPPGGHSKLKEMLSRGSDITSDRGMIEDDDLTLVEEPGKASPIVISEESNQDSMAANADLRDPLSEIPVFEITPQCVKTINPQPVAPPPVVEVPVVAPPAPRKRGRPRKVPLQVREDFKDPKDEEPKPVVVESTRPKRSCRGQSVRTTLGIKPRKPRGPGRGRGSKRGMGTRSTTTPPETPPKAAKEPKLGGTKLKELKEESFLLSDKSEVKIEIDHGFQKSPSNSLLAPPQSDTSTTDRADIVMYEEETRMSAETSSRAQTPAKQVVTTTVDLVEESQSSVQSTATTESVKVRRGPRLEVHQEPEGAVISADQLAEYFWSGGGPFMLQEQVAQFLGIKSFKRKYPNIARRVVDMQERDFIRESGLAGEAMCDLGLTAVNSSDILDIMYSDFQDKYEEYCKHQRDRQAKDLINKQKALSLAASQEKAKMDITQQAVQSAASWNATFNKSRRDQRKSCMDLQTLTIHFPKGKMKQINKPKMGYYPVALVPGQFTDYYREFTPTEINNLPLSTLCYEPVIRSSPQEMECDSQTDGSGSESDSSSSDSDSSYSGSSDGEDCTLCKPTPKRVAAAQ